MKKFIIIMLLAMCFITSCDKAPNSQSGSEIINESSSSQNNSKWLPG